jgi:hypothetical protein
MYSVQVSCLGNKFDIARGDNATKFAYEIVSKTFKICTTCSVLICVVYVCVCVCVYIYTHTYIYIHTYIHTRVFSRFRLFHSVWYCSLLAFNLLLNCVCSRR